MPVKVSSAPDRFSLVSFSLSVNIYNVENLQDPKLFNYFYLSRYFLGSRMVVFSSKKYFVLGKTYYNLRLGFFLNADRLDLPLSL